MSETHTEHHLVADEIAELLDRKRSDYGVENIRKFGSRGCLIRISDKVERLINITWVNSGRDPNYEAVADSYRDICGYAILALIELEAGR